MTALSVLPAWARDRIVADEAGCWLWTASINANGYGVCARLGERLAHRVIFRLVVGAIPEGFDLDHLCRVRHCVNPAHLEPVTRRENLRRSPLTQAGRTRCVHGHARWAIRPDGTRRCLECHRVAERERYHRRREAA